MSDSYKFEMRFDDVDDFTETVRGWNMEYWQLERGGFDGHLVQVGLSHYLLGNANFNRKMHQVGLPPEGGWTFVIPNRNEMSMRWRGHMVTGDQLMCFPYGGELDAVADSTFDIMTLTIDRAHVERKLAQLELGPSEQILSGREVCSVDPRLMLALRMQLKRIHQLSAERLAANSERLEGELDSVLGYILTYWAHLSEPKKIAPVTTRSRVIQEAAHYIESNIFRPISVRELCQHLQVSERTLQYAFKQQYRCTPKQYMNARRLHGVRKILRRQPQRSVGNVAQEWGYWHLGQFAADYRKLFGELPSATQLKYQ